jgi:hypothetical protein
LNFLQTSLLDRTRESSLLCQEWKRSEWKIKQEEEFFFRIALRKAIMMKIQVLTVVEMQKKL